MKSCKKSTDCMFGNAINRGFGTYNENIDEEDICPILVDAWDIAPNDMDIISKIGGDINGKRV